MEKLFEFKLNGAPQRVESEPARSLLEVLREDLELTGTKYGCGEGQCRSCTVLVDGVAATSCNLPIESLQGRHIETIEGVGKGAALDPVQEAFLEAGAMQCGYCVPGMVMTLVGLLRENPNPAREHVVGALNAHICRCCGYLNVLEAALKAARVEGAK